MLLSVFYSVNPMAAEQNPQSSSVQALCRLSQTYGRALCREPQRVEAMLRDLCPDQKREIFLLVSALKEQIVPDLISAYEGAPADLVYSRSCQKLYDNLGFTEESAVWAVESWLEASRILAATPDIPLPSYGPPQSDDISIWQGNQSTQTGLDWIWLALCFAALLASALAVRTVAWFSLHHDLSSFQSWLKETSIFTSGLLGSGFTLFLVARQFGKRRIPNHWVKNQSLGAAAMLCEVLVILALPIVPVVSIALWAGEWAKSWHMAGQFHDLAFHLSRILQSLPLLVFLWQWTIDMIRIQGRLGSSAIGRRK